MNTPFLTLSIVSHGQGLLIKSLLSDLLKVDFEKVEIILVLNIPEDEFFFQGYPFKITILRNLLPQGFGANHNLAFSKSTAPWFCVVNPDIKINSLIFEDLLYPFSNPNVFALSPLIFSPTGILQDNARFFPTFARLFKRFFLLKRGLDYKVETEPFQVDWLAGMFLVFRRESFIRLNGFDSTRFFMYLEDADICRRIKLSGGLVVINPIVSVIHDAQHASRKNIKHLRWHITSALRYLTGL